MRHEQLLADLIEIKSYSGEEGEIRSYIDNWFGERGIDSFEQDENLIIYLQGKDRTRAFIFNSHMDTVSAGDKPWRYGPWNPTLLDKKMIGLGASDMKSGLTASMLLAEEIAKGGKPPIDMWFTYVVKEEVDGSGTQSFADWFAKEGYPKRYKDMVGIFTEPTRLKEIEHGHRGNMFIEVTTQGDSGHASRPHLIKTHAVREMISFSDSLQKQMQKWQKEFASGIFNPPSVGEMTSIQAGDSPNKFPSLCKATFDIRTTPEFHKVAFKRIVELGKEVGAEVEYKYPPAPAGFTDPSERIVEVSRKALGGARLSVSQGSADLGFLTAHGIKAVIFGPGESDQAHKVNEYCYPSKIPQAVEIYKEVVEAWVK